MFRILVLALLTTGPLLAQADLIKIQQRIDSVPRPQAFLGYELGDRHTSTTEAIRYARAVAAASDSSIGRR